jgi:hypothetical protein
VQKYQIFETGRRRKRRRKNIEKKKTSEDGKKFKLLVITKTEKE